MKSILVYIQTSMLAPRGGKLGYNYCLKSQLDKMGIKNIHYIDSKKTFAQSANDKIKSMDESWRKQFLVTAKSIYNKFRTLYGCSHRSLVDLSSYDIVHFHSTLDMYRVRDSLKSYTGIVVLTSHTPTIQSQEIYDALTNWEKMHMNWLYKNLIRIDDYGFRRADFIIFPCPDAEEPYYKNWPEYVKIKQEKRDCYRYLLTGTEARYAKLSRTEVCKQFDIPENAFIISYVGRHNEIKGYDTLKLLGERMLEKYPNAYFLIAGREDPLSGLEHPRWIEVGWTSDPHSLIAASDVFILPNKETYFDLVMLEVLSLGKIVIASNTGGNKYFKSIGAEGIFTYTTLEEAEELVQKVYAMGEEEKLVREQGNKRLFNQQFSLEMFANNYVKLINSL